MSQYEYRIHPTLPRLTTSGGQGSRPDTGETTWSFSNPACDRIRSSASDHARLHEAKIKAKRQEEKEAAAREMRQQEEEEAAREAAEELAKHAETDVSPTPVQKVSRASDHPSPVDIRQAALRREQYAARQVESRPSTPPNRGHHPRPATPGPSHPATPRMQTPSRTTTPSRPVTPGMYNHTPARRATAPGAYTTTTTSSSRPATPCGYTRPVSRAAGHAQGMRSPVPRVATPVALNEPTNSWRDWKYDPSVRPRMRTPPTPDYPPPAYTENP